MKGREWEEGKEEKERRKEMGRVRGRVREGTKKREREGMKEREREGLEGGKDRMEGVREGEVLGWMKKGGRV